MRTIDEIWRLAREDAGIAPEEVRVYVLRGAKRGDYWAMYFKPGDWLVFDQNFPFCEDQLDDANGAGLTNHRVAVYAGVQEPELAGLMRHELEHAVQQRRYGDASWTAYERALGALARQYDNRRFTGRRWVDAGGRVVSRARSTLSCVRARTRSHRLGSGAQPLFGNPRASAGVCAQPRR